MKPLDQNEIRPLQLPASIALRPLTPGILERLKRRFQSQSDLHQLNAHFLKDAGIDEQDLEQTRALKAPLIR